MKWLFGILRIWEVFFYYYYYYCWSLNWNVENIFLYVNVDMVCARFVSVTLYFTAFLGEDEPLKMFQQRKDIIFSHKSLSFWININVSCSKCCALFTIYICLTFKTWVYFRLIGKCIATTNRWKWKIRRNESGLRPPVPCLPCLDSKSEWEDF